ncbi:MAG: 12,18-didecarboxysiroheme deacetylase, partial [Chloroflexota bacterium]
MISISRLLCGAVGPGDSLRYGIGHKAADKQPPIIVWNCTRKCNLHCVHCYSHSQWKDYENELTTEEGKKLI